MEIPSVTKIEEGRYNISSLPCPDCNTIVTFEIDGSALFLARQGGSVQSVLPDKSADIRERFVSGYCAPCWTKLFDYDDDDEAEEEE
jgi:hypothetical protein